MTDKFSTRPAARGVRPAGSAPKGAPRVARRWPFWLHAGLTAALALALGGLAATGRVRLEEPGPGAAAPPTPGAAPEAGERGGRYRIEEVKKAGNVFADVGRVGFMGDLCQEVRVFRYQGGLLECRLEGDLEVGKVGLAIPADWKRQLADDAGFQNGDLAALRKEGYVVLAVVAPSSAAEQVKSYLPQLGGGLAGGPAGPLNGLPLLFLDAWHAREVRLFLSAAPPEGTAGAGFRNWISHPALLRAPLTAPPEEVRLIATGGGSDLKAGVAVPLLTCAWPGNRLRLQARFLTEEELAGYRAR